MTYRAEKIRGVLEESGRDDYDKLRDIERICGDHSIRHFVQRELDRIHDGCTDERTAARRIDEEQDYYDRQRRYRDREDLW